MEIVYQDQESLVVNKPAGWITTRENTKSETLKSNYLEDWVGENFPNNLLRKGIVHRLDKGTSGLVLIAKTETALINFKQKFKNRQVVKHYYAMVGGDLPRVGNIKMPISRSKYSFGKFKVEWDGKMAETEFEVVRKYVIEGKRYSLVDINLKTGRTHQIRVHFSYMGWPLLGDRTYGGQMIATLARPFLHAYYLGIGDKNFKSELAEDLILVLKEYEKT